MKFSRLFTAFAIMAVAFAAAAQSTTPQRDALAALSAKDYASLLSRFTAGQELSHADISAVYFGAPLHQKGFNAARQYPAIKNAYDSGDMKQTHTLAADALKSDPTNLYLLFKAFASASASTDADVKRLAPKYQQMLLGVCDAIFNSGRSFVDSSPLLFTHPSDVDEFITKYLQPTTILGRSTLGDLEAVKMNLDGVPDAVIIYFQQFK